MQGINRVVLVGRMTRDPELRRTNSDISVATFSLAIDRRSGQGQEQQTDFINCVAWRQLAEITAKYTHKGSLVAVEGRIQTRKYTDKQGNSRTATEVVCDNLQFLESKGSSSSGSYQHSQDSSSSSFSDSFNDYSDADALNISTDDLPF